MINGETVATELQIRKTNNYDQFRRIVGNRPINMAHVNDLVARIAKHNMLAQFPIVVTRDGYLIDGQHRLAAASANNWDIYFIVSPVDLEDIIVALINSSQVNWNIGNYVDFFAQKGNAQYIWLKQLAETRKVSIANLLSLFKGNNETKLLKKGELVLYQTADEQAILLDMLNGYLSLRDTFLRPVWKDMDFVQALRVMFQQVTVAEIQEYVAKYNKQILPQSSRNDYLRLFEDIFNKRRSAGTKVRFF
jgi:hypothetical protein